jgi:hypothetical protein
MQIASQLGLSHYLDLAVTAAARDQLLEQMQWGLGDDDFSAVARKYLPETESPDYEKPQLPEKEEQAGAEAIAPALEAAPLSSQMSSPPSDTVETVDSGGNAEDGEALPWRRGFLTQLLRRGRQARKSSGTVPPKEE